MRKWKTLKTEDVSPSKWLPVERHEVRLPNGKVLNDFYIVGPWRIVFVIGITKDNEIVLVRQYKHGVGNFTIELPAGFIDKHETPQQAAKRELLEETGYRANKLTKLRTHASAVTKLNKINYGFICRNLSNPHKQSLDENEEIEVIKVPLKELEEFIINHTDIIPAETLAFLYLFSITR